MDFQTEKEIISIIADVTGFEEDEISPDTNIVEDLEVDSIKAIEITVAIEKKFKISIRDEDVPRIISVRQAVELVQKLLQPA
ncbi:MAG TPA: acyl carrier protein [Nitrospirota bacterium]|nr:acyl carrier protein [Nitrospirota bacterium]